MTVSYFDHFHFSKLLSELLMQTWIRITPEMLEFLVKLFFCFDKNT